MIKPETRLQISVAEYLVQNYPDVIFHSDFGSGIKLPPHLAKIQAAQNGGRRSYPDLFIAEPRRDIQSAIIDGRVKSRWLHGLYIELKAEGTTVFKRNSEVVADKHIREQAAMLARLREKGYAAEFGIGYAQTISIIDKYMRGEDGWQHSGNLFDDDSADDSCPF